MAMLVAVCACGPAGRSNPGGDDSGGDAGTGDAVIGSSGDAASTTFVYAHTSSQLYKIDPDTLAVMSVGNFTFAGFPDQITDIAIDGSGLMIGISYTAVYRIDTATAACTRLSQNLGGTFNGLSFVPATAIGQTGADVLVATQNANGVVSRIDPATGAATSIGNMNGFSSSGDLVSVVNLGTLQTADNGSGADRLVRLAPGTFAATPVGSDIGYADIWGVAFWKDKIFGFTEAGQFITIDPTTGAGTLVQGNGPHWWGAAVTTTAPVIF